MTHIPLKPEFFEILAFLIKSLDAFYNVILVDFRFQPMELHSLIGLILFVHLKTALVLHMISFLFLFTTN